MERCTVLFCSKEKSELSMARSKREAGIVVYLLTGKLNDVIIVYSSGLFHFNYKNVWG